VALHEAVGFKLVGVYRGIGFKHGSWHDVAWYEAEVQPETSNPPAPKSLEAVVDSQQWRDGISRGLNHYQRR
jgi:phosphinothricin acetyltransferase